MRHRGVALRVDVACGLETSLDIEDLANAIGMTFTVLGAVLYWVAGAMYGREAFVRVRSLPKEPPVI